MIVKRVGDVKLLFNHKTLSCLYINRKLLPALLNGTYQIHSIGPLKFHLKKVIDHSLLKNQDLAPNGRTATLVVALLTQNQEPRPVCCHSETK